MSQTALFINFTDQEFTGYWNGKGRAYPPGVSEYMPDYLAQHFAKHLVNRELLRSNPSGQMIYKDGDKMTSPKFPEQFPIYMELFNKAYISDNLDAPGENQDNLDSLIASANKNRSAAIKAKSKIEVKPQVKPQNVKEPLNKPRNPKPQEDEKYTRETSGGTGPQVITPPDWNEDDESQFKGKPK